MEYETILYDVVDEVATVTLNRPAKMNAYTTAMGAEITDAMLRADADNSVRVVIITGAGDRAFCAGADMSMFASDIKTREGKDRPADRAARWCGGLAATGDAQSVEADDRRDQRLRAARGRMHDSATVRRADRVGRREDGRHLSARRADERARIELPDVPRLIGLARTAEMMLTGRQYPASECLAMSLVSRVVPLADLPATARELAADMLQCSPTSLAFTRKALYRGLDGTSSKLRWRSRDSHREVLRQSRAQGIRRGVFGEAQAEF